jgi:hypothetical protein
MATETLKRLVGPAAMGVAAATVYTAPAQTKAVIRQIQIVNNAGTDQLVTISVGADAAAKRIWRRNCVANEVDGMTCTN